MRLIRGLTLFAVLSAVTADNDTVTVATIAPEDDSTTLAETVPPQDDTVEPEANGPFSVTVSPQVATVAPGDQAKFTCHYPLPYDTPPRIQRVRVRWMKHTLSLTPIPVFSIDVSNGGFTRLDYGIGYGRTRVQGCPVEDPFQQHSLTFFNISAQDEGMYHCDVHVYVDHLRNDLSANASFVLKTSAHGLKRSPVIVAASALDPTETALVAVAVVCAALTIALVLLLTTFKQKRMPSAAKSVPSPPQQPRPQSNSRPKSEPKPETKSTSGPTPTPGQEALLEPHHYEVPVQPLSDLLQESRAGGEYSELTHYMDVDVGSDAASDNDSYDDTVVPVPVYLTVE